MKLKKIKLITFLLIGIGVILLSYPIVSNWLVSSNQTTAIKNYGLTVDEMNVHKKQDELNKARKYNEILRENKIVDQLALDSGNILPEEYLAVLNVDGVIGFIAIPKIDVYIPIYHGTDEATLKKGVGHIHNTAFPIGGEGNHSVLTGHNGLTSAKLFTDLEKLEIGDIFYITVMDEKLTYKIDQILTVEPSDTKELIPIKNKDYVTLITCTPYGINSHRLFVRAERTYDGHYEEKVHPINNIFPICMFSLIALLIIIIPLTLKCRRSKSS